jgi:hypothetical protein
MDASWTGRSSSLIKEARSGKEHARLKRADFIGSMALNLAHLALFRSRIMEIAGEPTNEIKKGNTDPALAK